MSLFDGWTVIVFLLQTGQLNEYTERKEMSSSVVCMALGRVPAGEQRSRFLAVGLSDNTIRIISLQPQVHSDRRLFYHVLVLTLKQPDTQWFRVPQTPNTWPSVYLDLTVISLITPGYNIHVLLLQDCLSPLSMQALPAAPESLCVVEMGGHDITREDVEGGSRSGLFLNIGLQVQCLFITINIITIFTRYLQSLCNWQRLSVCLSVSVIFVLIYFLVLVLVFQLFFSFSFVLVFIIF